MSYCVTITRRMNDEGAAEPAISLDEWKTVVDSDAELSNPSDYKVVRWRGVSSEREPNFEWCDGEIFVHNPDTAQLKKIGILAVRLGARVVTEDGEIDQFEEEVEFDPATAYDAYLSRAGTRRFTWDTAIDFVAAHFEVVFPLGGLAFVIGRSFRAELWWPEYLIAFLAADALVLHGFYSYESRRAADFSRWLLRNIVGLTKGAVEYGGVPVTLDTRITRFSGAYSFFLSSSEWSRWYFVGVNDQPAKWIHSVISLFFGIWGLPWGPFHPITSLVLNLKTPNGDITTVRNLCLNTDDRLCVVLGRRDPEL